MRALIAVPVLLAACTFALADVECPADAPKQETFVYEELWRTDAYSDDYLMGNITAGTMDDEGALYLLDQQLQEVFKFDAAGEYAGTIVHQGEGPGEISQVWNIEWWSPDSLILPQAFPPRVVRVNAEGIPQDELKVYLNEGDDAPVSTTAFSPCGDYAVVGGSLFTFSAGKSERQQWLGVIGRSGVVRHKFAERSVPMPSNPLKQKYDEAAEFWSWDRWAVNPDGRVFAAPEREAYLIQEYDLDGNLKNTWRRPRELRQRSEEELARMRTSRTFVFNGKKAEIEYTLSEVDAPIEGILAFEDEVWVRLDREPEAEGHGLMAVHALDGTLKSERLIDIPHDPKNDVVVLLDAEHAIVIENGVGARAAQFARFSDGEVDEELNAEPIEVVLYRVKR